MQYGNHPYELGSRHAPGVTPKDIAHSKARINRFTGHTNGVLSVARHEVFVSQLLDFDPLVAMYGLCHENHETVTQDLSWPVKQSLGWFGLRRYRYLAKQADYALYEVLGVPFPIPEDIKALVKRADNAAQLAEKRDLMPPCSREWDMVPGHPALAKVTPTKSAAEDAALWLARYHELAKHLNITPKVWND